MTGERLTESIKKMLVSINLFHQISMGFPKVCRFDTLINFLSYLILSYLILSYLILSYLILSYLILSYLILSYLILSYQFIPHRELDQFAILVVYFVIRFRSRNNELAVKISRASQGENNR